ncbi:MAG TPA: hypothetical protein VFI06_02660 [Chitinophagaceae bacterium]|nr:hypothetical protein [Chitinophagaceae bacterium]
MKRTILFPLWWMCLAPSLQGQELRVGLYEGKTFGRDVDNYHYTADYYQGTIKGAARHGIGVACLLENSYSLELLYYHQDTKVPTTFHSTGGSVQHEFDMTIQWVLLEFVAFLTKKSLRPFLGSDIGIGVLTLKDPMLGDRSSRVKFTWGGNLGLEFAFRKLISIRVKADLLYSVKFNYAVSGNPFNSNITAYNHYLQSGINGGIIFRFGLPKKK